MDAHLPSGVDIDLMVIEEQYMSGRNLDLAQYGAKVGSIWFHHAELAGVELPLEQITLPQNFGHITSTNELLIRCEVTRYAVLSQCSDRGGDIRIYF